MIKPKRPYEAMIAAGGYGRRFIGSGSPTGRPKSLMMGVSRPMVVSTAENAREAGFRTLLVLNNRPEWHHELKEVLAPFDGVDVVEDAGYSSTFLLAQNFAEKMDTRFLFLYGHAPRPAEHLRYLAKLKDQISASAFENSTKTKVIPRGKLFLEPPYMVDCGSIVASNASDWASYFEEVRDKLGLYISKDPAEPNTRAEFERYIKHYAANI
jgi:CTP:molybdopterin cytidylyltransferase MocA